MESERKLAKRRQRPPLIDPRPGNPPAGMTTDSTSAQPSEASQPTPDRNTGGYPRTDSRSPDAQIKPAEPG